MKVPGLQKLKAKRVYNDTLKSRSQKKQNNANDINKKQCKTTNNVCFYMIFKNLGSDRIWRKIKFFIVFLLRNPLFPHMDAFFKKSVENKASTENLQKTYKNQYYLMKNIRKNNKYHRKPSQKRRKKTKKRKWHQQKLIKKQQKMCVLLWFSQI